MGPRKRAKLNPHESDAAKEAQPQAPTAAANDAEEASNDTGTKGTPASSTVLNRTPGSKTDASSIKTTRSTPKWYGDSWPRISKAAAVTQVARETISAASGKDSAGDTGSTVSLERTADPKEAVKQPTSPSVSLSRKRGGSSRPQPIAATATKLNVTATGAGNTTDGAQDPSQNGRQPESQDNTTAAAQGEEVPGKKVSEEGRDDADAKEKATVAASGWFNWLPMTGSNTQTSNTQTKPDAVRVEETPTQTNASQDTSLADGAKAAAETTPEGQDPEPSTAQMSQTQQYGKSWFGYWIRGAESKAVPSQDGVKDTIEQAPKDDPPTTEIPADTTETADKAAAESSPIPARASVWAFWSRTSTAPQTSKATDPDVPDAPPPSAATATEVKDQPPATKSESVQPRPDEPKQPVKETDQVPPPTQDPVNKKAVAASVPASGSKAVDPVPKPTAQRLGPPNILLPSVRDTYQPMENESLLRHLARLLLPGKHHPPRHTSLVQHPPRIKRALAIGVHGFFPAQFVRTFIGRPTGTSFKFASAAADAIKAWASNRGYDCDVEAIALEGEGKIAERVDLLWKLTLNWIDKIRSADFVLVACHSQGVPVATMLVAKLIEFGCLQAARVGVCAMAGINLGPFPDYKSRLFSGSSAGELFEFTDSNSAVSKRHEDALRIAVKHGVRMVYVGSIDDQLVPLESSIFSTVNHPYIYRAVFIDGRVHAPDFITHLVGFALKLRNLGISDHGLIRELSSPLAGSLYTGEGHSRLYDDQIVYNLAVEFALETSSVGDVRLHVQNYEPRNPSSNNPFILPWAMRGLLEEEYVRNALRAETAELLALFDNWKPTTKVLKDVKFRLEAVKSKL